MVGKGSRDRASAREFDLVLFGATGFTGAMTAAHIARHARPELRIALAGRSLEKLERIRARLDEQLGPARRVSLIEADVRDPQSLARMAARTRALVSTVGPFVDYGEPVVAACIAERTDYVDSTGEYPFVRDVVERHGTEAARAGVKLISACGFDSIPADLGVLYTVLHLPPDEPLDIRGYLSFRGVFSGGTERSAIKTLAAPLPHARDLHVQSDGREARVQRGRMGRVASLGAWTTALETVDPVVVLRSAAALRRYGPRFSYTHHLVHPSLLAALATVGMAGTVVAMARMAPLRALMLKLVKRPGEGPTEAQMDAGWFCLRLEGRARGRRVLTEVSGGDPGYRETSMMLGQSALCLVEDGDRLPTGAGALTPAAALGPALLERLQRQGMRFRVLESEASAT